MDIRFAFVLLEVQSFQRAGPAYSDAGPAPGGMGKDQGKENESAWYSVTTFSPNGENPVKNDRPAAEISPPDICQVIRAESIQNMMTG
jgi:hypothetical protein